MKQKNLIGNNMKQNNLIGNTMKQKNITLSNSPKIL
jgi:hypothetical protein